MTPNEKRLTTHFATACQTLTNLYAAIRQRNTEEVYALHALALEQTRACWKLAEDADLVLDAAPEIKGHAYDIRCAIERFEKDEAKREAERQRWRALAA